jgi:pSer/pThr/pTyr-binding forkhead associated (FHA) protein
MKQPPAIVVQLVHIEGPLKGQIQEFRQSEITIGRHASCQVQFPKDLAIVSRQHARIVRDGNRFILMDQSSNGTFVNGKSVKEVVLKDGDVLLFADGGPKVSFLTQVLDHAFADETPAPPLSEPPEPAPEPESVQPSPAPPVPPSSSQAVPEQPPKTSATPIVSVPGATDPGTPKSPDDMPIQQIKKPLVIQYGPTLQAFQTLPVTIGNGPACDFKVEHSGVLERHAQVFFHGDHYWIKDLTGKNLIRIDGNPVTGQGMLVPEAQLSLTETGPAFRFLGGGRLAEIEPETPERGAGTGGDESGGPKHKGGPGKGVRELGALMKRMLKR